MGCSKRDEIMNTLFIMLMWLGVYFPFVYFFRIRRWKKKFVLYLCVRILLSLAVLGASIKLGSQKNTSELQYYLESIQNGEIITIIYTIFIVSTILYDAYLISKTRTFLYPVN